MRIVLYLLFIFSISSFKVDAAELSGLLMRPTDFRITDAGLISVLSNSYTFDVEKGTVSRFRKDGFVAGLDIIKDEKYFLSVKKSKNKIENIIESQPSFGASTYDMNVSSFDANGRLTFRSECTGQSEFVICDNFTPELCKELMAVESLYANNKSGNSDLDHDLRMLHTCASIEKKLQPILKKALPEFSRAENLFNAKKPLIKDHLKDNWKFSDKSQFHLLFGPAKASGDIKASINPDESLYRTLRSHAACKQLNRYFKSPSAIEFRGKSSKAIPTRENK